MRKVHFRSVPNNPNITSTACGWPNISFKYVTDDIHQVTCGACQVTRIYLFFKEKERVDDLWKVCRSNSPSFQLVPMFKKGLQKRGARKIRQKEKVLRIKTIPVTPEQAAVMIDTISELFGIYLHPEKREK